MPACFLERSGRPITELFTHHRARFIDCQRATAEFVSIELLDGLVGLFSVHGDEAESFGSAGFTVNNNAYRFDSADLRKQVGEIFFGGSKRQISNVNFFG